MSEAFWLDLQPDSPISGECEAWCPFDGFPETRRVTRYLLAYPIAVGVTILVTALTATVYVVWARRDSGLPVEAPLMVIGLFGSFFFLVALAANLAGVVVGQFSSIWLGGRFLWQTVIIAGLLLFYFSWALIAQLDPSATQKSVAYVLAYAVTNMIVLFFCLRTVAAPKVG